MRDKATTLYVWIGIAVAMVEVAPCWQDCELDTTRYGHDFGQYPYVCQDMGEDICSHGFGHYLHDPQR
jgi:hypothetical protein